MTESSQTDVSKRFPIVGIGASAGGFDALRRLLQAMPDAPPLAIVIIQHLARDRPSLAPDLLSNYTSMQLSEVEDKTIVRPGHVYLIPPGKHLRIRRGRLHLSEMDGPRGALVTVDSFLRSLAQDQTQCAVGVILSGSGSDGALGIKAIKEAGGFVIAQDVGSAEQTGMPESAIRTGLVDRVLAPEEIPDVLVRLARDDYVCTTRATGPSESSDSGEETPDEAPLKGLEAILSIVRDKTGRDFSTYKHATLLRRSRRRMCLHHTDSLERYREILEQDEDEVRSLSRDLLISVTDFFRDRGAWDELAKDVIPKIVESKTGSSLEGSKNEPENTVRIWVPGCATGEEAYTVAMLTLDEVKRQQKLTRLQVFASDIDRSALRTAREGRYPTSIATDVSSTQLERYFELRDGDIHYQVKQLLRDVVTFAEQDLIGDPPFSQLDLICCRNVLIYLKPTIQTKVLELFHFALGGDGGLMLGTAETIGRHKDWFKPISKRWRIYRAHGPKRSDRLPLFIGAGRSRREVRDTPATAHETHSAHLTQQRMLQLVAPRGILVDRESRILYISGNVDEFLSFQTGLPSDDLLGNVRDGLRSQLRAAIQTAFAERRTVSAAARLLGKDPKKPVRIEVRYLEAPPRQEPLALVMFDPPIAKASPIEPRQAAGETDDPTRELDADATLSIADPDRDVDESEVIRQLERELIATKADLRQTIEQFETSNEEYKASTEEVMSINEELQSTNEELESSKEELQSLNEELSAVNLQLSTKVGELETKHADLENLIDATNVATICLDTELRIRWFTEAAGQVVRIRHTDFGRPLADLQHDFIDNGLVPDCREVLRTLTPIERERPCLDDRTFIRRVVPYRASSHRIGGLVITLVDISSRIRREAELWASEEKLRLAAEAARLGWYSYDVQNDTAVWSRELRAILGVRDDETIDLQRAKEFIHPEDRAAYAEHVESILSNPRYSHYRGEFRCLLADDTIIWLEDRGRVIWRNIATDDPQPQQAVGMVMDITERKDTELQLQELNKSLEQQVTERTGVLETLQSVTRIANESVSIKMVAQSVLQELARFDGYQVGCLCLAGTSQDDMPRNGDAVQSNVDSFWQGEVQPSALLREVRQFHDHSDWLKNLHQQSIDSGHVSWFADLEVNPEAEGLVSLGIRSLVVAPVRLRDDPIATIAFFGSKRVEPSMNFRGLLEDAARQLAHAIERNRLQQVVGRIADEEQRRIGRELHDTISQQLTGGALVARALKESLSAGESPFHETVDQLIEIFSTTHRSVRELSAGLMHNAARAEDLISVLQGLCGEVTRRFGVGCELNADEYDSDSLRSDDAAIAIAQVAREAIHNAVKHASPTHIDVEIATDEVGVRLIVSDDGVGISAPSADQDGNGLRIMRFRANSLGGDLQVNSPAPGGTNVILSLPYSSC